MFKVTTMTLLKTSPLDWTDLNSVILKSLKLFLLQDVSKINEGKQPLYQEDTNKRILNSLELLTGLDEDAVNAKHLRHPQAEMIEQE